MGVMVKKGRAGSFTSLSPIYKPMEIRDKVIWSNGYSYEIAWLERLNGDMASIKLITGPKEDATVSKPIKELERFTEASYEAYSKKFGKKFGG